MSRFKLLTPSTSALQGQGLSEYALVIALVGVVCLVGLIAFGKELLTLTSNLQAMVMGQPASMPASAPSSTTLPPVPIASASSPATPPASVVASNPVSASGNSQLSCLTSGWCVDTSVPVTNVPDPVTTGANGIQMVHGYSDVLDQLAQIVAQNPDMPPDLQAKLTALANAGHTVANTEVDEVYKTFDSDFSVPASVYMDTAKQANTTYTSLHTDVLALLGANPGLLPPDVTQLIAQASGYIQDHSNYFSNLGTNDQATAIWTGIETGGSATTISAEDHQNANTICTNGGDTSQCVQ